jgi:hypothetical protein
MARSARIAVLVITEGWKTGIEMINLGERRRGQSGERTIKGVSGMRWRWGKVLATGLEWVFLDFDASALPLSYAGRSRHKKNRSFRKNCANSDDRTL